LGDVWFQLVFLLEMFQEQEAFTLSDVVAGVAQKMIRRHPHVYGDAKVSTEKELNRQWDSIKAGEQGETDRAVTSALDRVPRGMPSLIRALKVSGCAVKEGFDWENIHGVLDTVKDEIQEFETALASGDESGARMEFGDILFSLVNVARVAGFHPETALAESTAKFEGRFRLMEVELKAKQASLKDMSMAERDRFWSRAKLAYDR
jgi:MazG family protein